MDYKDTITLPKTDFPLRGNLPKKEPEILKQWDGLYEELRRQSEGRAQFHLHLGPPFANNNIHIGHALTTVLKDVVVKSKQMIGYDAPLVPGWDCHGMPIEIIVSKKLGKKAREMPVHEFRQECRKFAEKWVETQKESFKRLGILADWDNPYLTMDWEYEADVVAELHKFLKSGNLYRDLKPVHWCPNCATALAEAEIEYKDVSSTAVYVKFPLVSALDEEELSKRYPVSLVVWTTTPWSLPANQAVCINPNEYYDFVYLEEDSKLLEIKEAFVVAESRIEDFIQRWDTSKGKLSYYPHEEFNKYKGSHYLKDQVFHPFLGKKVPVIADRYVTTDVGTGCVHIAPDHGDDDFRVGQANGLKPIDPLTDYGKFKGIEGVEGKHVFKCEDDVLKLLGENLLIQEKYQHQYPHCWRCKRPTLTRATKQWFVSLDRNNLRQNVLEAAKGVSWYPEWGEERLSKMVESRGDWCISRQRVWGTPCAILTCTDCGEPVTEENTLKRTVRIIAEDGADAWWRWDVGRFLTGGHTCSCGSSNFEKTTDTIDVWIDSGVSHAAVMKKRFGTDVSDMYLEGSDQYRGWFMSSLTTSVLTTRKSPYKAVLSHGFCVDKNGEKMSKSKGNVIAPEDLIKDHGADLVRLWVVSSDYSGDVKIHKGTLKGLEDSYKRIRNTLRFLLGNLDEGRVKRVYPSTLIDSWVLDQLHRLQDDVLQAYADYKFHIVFQKIHDFCSETLGAFYLDIVKDRLYCGKREGDSYESVQYALFCLFLKITRLIAPILSFTAEEAWKHRFESSIHEIEYQTLSWRDDDLAEDFKLIRKVRADVYKEIEELRKEGVIGSSLEVDVELAVSKPLWEKIENVFKYDLEEIFLVSDIYPKKHLRWDEDAYIWDVEVSKTENKKCVRCWRHQDSIGQSEEHPELCERCVKVVSEI